MEAPDDWIVFMLPVRVRWSFIRSTLAAFTQAEGAALTAPLSTQRQQASAAEGANRPTGRKRRGTPRFRIPRDCTGFHDDTIRGKHRWEMPPDEFVN